MVSGIRKPVVKICCISSVEEAALAIAAGASAVGLVSAMPSGPGVIEESLISQIVTTVPEIVVTFLLTSQVKAEAIIEQHALCGTSTIQLVDTVELPEVEKLRSALPRVQLVQVIHVVDEGSVEEAKAIAPFVDAILLDSGNQKLNVKELGGTGRTHDWSLSRRICDEVNKPVYLAGGLTAENVAEAVRLVEPYGVDLCSSVRTNGKLDVDKLRLFMNAVLG